MGHLAGKDGTKTHGLLRVIITANRHILSPGQVWGWQPLIITHPKTSACPAVLLCSAWNPAFHPAGLLAAWAAGPTGWLGVYLPSAEWWPPLPPREGVGGAGTWALPCSLGLAEELLVLLVVQAKPRAEAEGLPLVGSGPGAGDAGFLLLPSSLVPAPAKSRDDLFSCQLCPR